MRGPAAGSPAARRVRRHRPARRERAREAQALGGADRLCRAVGGGRLQPGAPADRAVCRDGADRTASRATRKRRQALSTCSAGCRLPDPERIGFRYPHQVSGGQLQRAMTAMAMSCRPDLIIFDEPTTALDVTTQIEVLAAIKDIVRHFHTAAIYISHDLAVVAQMADRIMVLRYGTLVEEAPTREDAEPSRAALYEVALGGALAHEARGAERRRAAARRRHRCPLRRVPGAARRGRRGAPRADGRGGRRIGLRQVDARPRDLRAAAAEQRQDPLLRPAVAADARGAAQGAPAPAPDDLPVAGHRAEPAPPGARHSGPAARELPSGFAVPRATGGSTSSCT